MPCPSSQPVHGLVLALLFSQAPTLGFGSSPGKGLAYVQDGKEATLGWMTNT